MTAFQFPFQPQQAQRYSITLSGVTYVVRFTWCAPNNCWSLDIYDAQSNLIKGGVPLVTGADLLAQFAYLGIGGKLVVQSDNDPGLVPDYDTMGVTGQLYYLTDDPP